MNRIPALVIAFLFIQLFNSGSASSQKKIHTRIDYQHAVTKIIFPLRVADFSRKAIYQLDKNEESIAAEYLLSNRDTQVKLMVYVYPADEAYEDRLSNEYFKSLEAIASKAGGMVSVHPQPLIINKDGWRMVGLEGILKNADFCTQLTLFECGNYFIKFRIGNLKDTNSAILDSIKGFAIRQFSPVDILQQTPCTEHPVINIAPGAFVDTAILDAMLEYTGTKLKWIYDHVDSLERCAGYPSLYLEAHRVSMDAMLNKWNREKKSPKALNFEYFLAMEWIRRSGFLNEYLMDKHYNMLIVPKTTILNMEGYFEWKKKSFPKFNPLGRLYVMGFLKAGKTAKDSIVTHE